MHPLCRSGCSNTGRLRCWSGVRAPAVSLGIKQSPWKCPWSLLQPLSLAVLSLRAGRE